MRVLVLVILVLANAVRPAAAGTETAWQRIDFARVRLLAAMTAIGNDAAVSLALQVKLDPGFKTYWRSPGDGGVPPTLDWSRSSNVAAIDFLWPTPSRFAVAGYQTFGYANEVILPLKVRLNQPGQPTTIDVALTIGICRDICVLGEADFTLAIPLGGARPSRHAGTIAGAIAQLPDLDSSDIEVTATVLRPSGSEVLAVVTRRGAGPPRALHDAIIEGLDDFDLAPPAIERAADGSQTVALFRPTARRGASALAGRAVTITLIEGGRSFERRVTIAAP
ncbi:MAG: hypothetical protein EXQ91_00005 [Alphaproteobacteria bacterium]|nr:hypothetical protein [Alphaproteobacteria bacterium]